MLHDEVGGRLRPPKPVKRLTGLLHCLTFTRFANRVTQAFVENDPRRGQADVGMPTFIHRTQARSPA